VSNEPLLKKSDHVIYHVSGHVGSAEVNGIIAIKVVRVRKNEYIVDALPKKVPFLKRARLRFPISDNLADLGGILTGWSIHADGERVGEEVIPTLFGDRTLVRYQRVEIRDEGEVKTEQFVDPTHNFPYAARMSGYSGEIQFGIMETNIDWIKRDIK